MQEHPAFFRRFTENSVSFWRFLTLVFIFALVISCFLIWNSRNEEKMQMIYALHSRAESLIWSIEGGARVLLGGRNDPSDMLAEMGKQPGIAWIALVDAGGRIMLDSNPQLEGTLIYTPEELASLKPDQHIQGRFSPDDPDVYETWMLFQPARIRRHPNPARFAHWKYIFVALDVTYFNKHLNAYTFRLSLMSGLITFSALCLLALMFYIHNYRASKMKLRDTRAFADEIIRSYPAALLVADPAQQIKFLNEPAKRLFDIYNGHKPGSLQDLPFLDWNFLIDDLRNDQPVVDREMKLSMENGKAIPVSVSAAVLREGLGYGGYVFILRDLGEINLLKEKLAQSQRLSAIGKMAAGLAHEIRNPLSSICGYAHYLGAKLGDDPMGKATAELIEEEAQRLNGVLTDLLGFARPQALDLKLRSLNEIMRKAWRLAKPDADAKHVELTLELPLDMNPMDIVDADKLLQALLNLALNAIQATPEGGKVTMRLNHVGQAGKKGEWRLEVRDNGSGMSEQVQRQIFTPYFTTRPSGSGLGLPLAQQIVERHGGAISVWSAPDAGSTFAIILPDQTPVEQTT